MTDPIAYVEGQLQSIVAGQEKLHAQLKDLVKERNAMLAEIRRLRGTLEEAAEYFEGRQDIRDGEGGVQLPNEEMRLLTIIKQGLGELPS